VERNVYQELLVRVALQHQRVVLAIALQYDAVAWVKALSAR
jgi:hypothetical protein